jgi:serine/threonine protein kinase
MHDGTGPVVHDRVKHDGVVAVHEVGGDDESAWLAVDLVSGPDLQRLVDEHGPLPAGRAAEIVAMTADGLSAVHAAGLIHRDLKPANILLDQDRPIIADFGVARPVATVESALGIGLTGGTDWAHTDTSRAPEEAPRAGTVAYMAPEQWRGEAGDARTDIYALGGVLYTMLTARRPFPQRSLPELAYAVAIAAPPAPSAHGAPGAFDPVAATAMAEPTAESPQDRPLTRLYRPRGCASRKPYSVATGHATVATSSRYSATATRVPSVARLARSSSAATAAA